MYPPTVTAAVVVVAEGEVGLSSQRAAGGGLCCGGVGAVRAKGAGDAHGIGVCVCALLTYLLMIVCSSGIIQQ